MLFRSRQMTWALGMAATQSAGLREMFGSMSKNLHIGRAAQNGLLSALLAARGFTSSEKSLEAPRGFANVLGEAPRLDQICADFGARFEILQNTYKPYPCGVVLHPVIEGCVTLATRHAIEPQAVKRIALRCHPYVLELTGKRNPANTLEAKLSVFYSAAAALVARQMGPREFEAALIADARVRALHDKVAVEVDAAVREDEAHVEIELADGTRHAIHIEHVIGSIDKPMSGADIEAKFRTLTAPLLAAEQVDGLIGACAKLETLADAAEIARLAAAR